MKQFSSQAAEKDYYEHEAPEAEFITWYKQQEQPEYDKPSVTVDIVIMGYNKAEDQLKLLLIQRRGNPYRNSWALPGGFVERNESTNDSVRRETKEETGLTIGRRNVEQLHTFSSPHRDPRGWVITVSYLAFIGQVPPTAGDDTQDARWFNLERQADKIVLTSDDIEIEIDLETGKSIGKDTLAFDHNEIIRKGFNRIVNKMDHEPLILQVLGDEFTITEARKVFAKFLGVDYRTVDHSNFKKAMLQYFVEIGERPVGIGRPSKIYRLKDELGEKK
ncbi:NUDIX hydrolase [Enterococcus sp. CSURQ0835]|uniref:NUDIX hydrolase n=1 Tax=Enterococcus sp. CSURQ0835 TaxID=2681394 RepID=UPI00135C500E|nr:NUDIX hydrolase [Enterococcus sp. CSURQ0835]